MRLCDQLDRALYIPRCHGGLRPGPLSEDRRGGNVAQPHIIVEVLSATTESYDRGAKFAHYRRLPSLQEYVLVSQDKVLVERYTRKGDDWVLSEFNGLVDHCSSFTRSTAHIAVREIYAKVKFPDPSSA